MTMKGLLLVLSVMIVVRGHRYMRPSINNLEHEVEDLKKENERIYEALDFLETNLTAQIGACGNAGSAVSSSQSAQSGGNVKVSADVEERLRELEERIHAIRNYLSGEKKADQKLREESAQVIKLMNGKVKDTDQVIQTLRTNVANTLEGFEQKIEEVNVVANVIIDSEGTVMYGQVGSACTEYGQECVADQSECRSGRCQCLPGLSYSIQDRKCVNSCDSYGNTYQVVNKRIIYGFNNMDLNSTNLAECKQACEEANTFQCRSFDYFSQFKQCFLSENVVTDVPEDKWQYNSAGIHLQRDCAKRSINPGAQ